MFCLAQLFVVAVISTSSSSVRAAIDQCTGGGCVGYTINHVYGSDGPTTYNELPASQETLKGDTGRPGKAGPQGVPGTVGEKGVTGDTGPQGLPCECDNTELNKLKEEVAALSSSMNALDEKLEHNVTEAFANLQKLSNHTTASDEKFETKLMEIQNNFNKTYIELRGNDEKLEYNVTEAFASLQKLSNYSTVSDKKLERNLVEIEENFNQVYNRFLGPKSCATVLPRRSGVYLISPEPNEVRPISVYCNFSGSNEVWTTISHDSVDEVEVTCENPFCHKHNVSYTASMDQIKALIKVSRSCRQYIKYRCMKSLFWHLGSTQYAAWISRDGEKMNYWGGATSRRDRYCACGETGTCINPSKKCNCDINNSPETSDEGYLTDKSKLPVTAMWFGDAGESSEWGRHSLGKLECSGTA